MKGVTEKVTPFAFRGYPQSGAGSGSALFGVQKYERTLYKRAPLYLFAKFQLIGLFLKIS